MTEVRPFTTVAKILADCDPRREKTPLLTEVRRAIDRSLLWMRCLNNQKTIDLARLLKTREVKASEIQSGDILVLDYAIFPVVGVRRREDGEIELQEASENDIHISPEVVFKVLDRSVFKDTAP